MARDKLMKDQQATDAADIKEKKIQCIFFDGRKDQTLVFGEVDGVKKSTTIREEHYSVCSGNGE